MDIDKLTKELVTEVIKNSTITLSEGTEVGDDVTCPKCGHDWEIRKEDKRPFLCHSCGWDTMLDKYDKEALKRWKKSQKLDEIPKDKLKQVDRYADKQLNPVDVDLTGKHFFDRLRDPRNKKEITQAELIGFFKRLGKSKKEFLDFLNKYKQLVVTDDRTKINIPFMKKANKAIAKTIMRKNNFKTSNVKLQVSHKESYDRTKFYESYFSNLSPESFDVSSKNGRIIIQLDEIKNITESVNIEDKGKEIGKQIEKMEKEKFLNEASYTGNLGFEEMMKFYDMASSKQIKALEKLIDRGRESLAWKLVQKVTGTKLKGKEFEAMLKEYPTIDGRHSNRADDWEGLRDDDEMDLQELAMGYAGKEDIEELEKELKRLRTKFNKEKKERNYEESYANSHLSEGSIANTLGNGNNSARWTAPKQKRKLKIPQLAGYHQVVFPEADELDISDEEFGWEQVSNSKKYNNKRVAVRNDKGELVLEGRVKDLKRILKETKKKKFNLEDIYNESVIDWEAILESNKYDNREVVVKNPNGEVLFEGTVKEMKKYKVSEGGAATDGDPIPAECSLPMYKDVVKQSVRKLNIKPRDMRPLGSTGKKPKGQYCGDIDIAVDGFKVASENDLKFNEVQDFIFNKVSPMFDNVVNNKGTGVISFLYPIPNSQMKGQVDFMIVEDVDYAEWYYSSPNFTKNESKYKGLYANLFLVNIAKNVDTKDAEEYFEDEYEGKYRGELKQFTKFGMSPKNGLIKQLKSFKGKTKRVSRPKTVKDATKQISKAPEEILNFLLGTDPNKRIPKTFESFYKQFQSSDFPYPRKRKTIEKDFKQDIKRLGFPIPSEMN